MATSLIGHSMAAGQPLMSSSAVKMNFLGQQISSGDGREFVYVLAGATALVPGKLQQSPAEVTGDENLAFAAAAIGATQVTTTTTVTVAANQYAGGLLAITVTPGVGYVYRIKSHPAAAAAAVTLTLDDAIVVALTTSSRGDLINPFSGVIVNPTTATSSSVGAGVYPVAAAEYGWIQKYGPAVLLADGAITVGTNVIASNATAGAVEAGADAADLQSNVGVALTGIATTEYGFVKIDL